jgi:hypothetical protein
MHFLKTKLTKKTNVVLADLAIAIFSNVTILILALLASSHRIIFTYNIPMHRFYAKNVLSALLTVITLSAMHENTIFRI